MIKLLSGIVSIKKTTDYIYALRLCDCHPCRFFRAG